MIIREKIDKLLERFLVVIMALLVIDVLWQVISRYILSSPSSFTDELAGFLLIWVGLFGATYVAGKNEHLAIDLMVQKSGPARRKFLELFISACIILFCIFCTGNRRHLAGLYEVYPRGKISRIGNSAWLCIYSIAHQWSVDHIFHD